MKDGASSSNPPPPLPLPPSALLAPGFRFHPTDEELVIYYLKRKIFGRPLRVDAIGEIEIYRSEPWDLPAVSRLKSRDAEWFFFSHLDRKYSNRTRTNRATPGGYWKTTGKDRAVRHGPRTVGMKKTLVYHNGRAPRGDRTNWVMHEYRLEDEELAGSGIAQDGYVVCKIFQKSGPGPQNGAQYGGPFVEEEWEEDSNLAQEVPGGNSHDYMQITDFEQVQDRVDQPENMGLSVANSDVQNSGSGAEDPFLVNEIFHDQGFDGVIATPTDVFGGNNDLAIVPSHATSTHINEYLELNDLANYPSDHLQDESNGLNQQDYEFDEFFDTVDRTTDPADFQLSPNADDLFVLLSPINGEYPSDQLAEDNAVFYDAPGHGFPSANEGTVHESDSLNLPSRVDEAVFGPLDDIMAYFDDTDDYIHFSALDSSSGLQPVGSSSSNQPNFAPEDDGSSVRLLEAEPHDIAGQGFSSSVTLPEADHPMDSLNDEVNTESEANHGTISKHLVRMLGSISAPPALAAEFPSSPIKLSEQTLASSSIHVTASLIQIRGFQVVGSASRKDGDVSFLLSCGVTSGDVDGCKLRGWAMSVAVLMRGGLCGFFLWAMFLAMCCKIGIRVYCR